MVSLVIHVPRGNFFQGASFVLAIRVSGLIEEYSGHETHSECLLEVRHLTVVLRQQSRDLGAL